MKVVELWRYPVKSLLGERLDAVQVTAAGLEGDRRFALFDVDTGFGLTARRAPELLFASAKLRGDGGVDITLPDGSVTHDDYVLSAWLGRPVTLRSVDAGVSPQYESPIDFEDEVAGRWGSWEGPQLAFHDSAGAQVSLVTSATLGAWDWRRFRSNVYLDGEGEDDWVGSSVGLGSAVLDVGMRIGRCVMTTRPQAGGVERDLDVMRTINRERGGYLSVGALVRQPDSVRVGDTLMQA